MKAVACFDMDGTLIDSGDLAVQTARRALQVWGRARGVRVPFPGAAAVRALVGLPSLDYFAGLLPEVHREEAPALRDIAGVLETRALAEGGAALFPDAASTLDALRGAGFGLALVSNCGPVYFAACLEHLGLASWFDFTACLGDRPTKTANVAAALERLDTRTGVMVGDRRGDIEAGRANGLRTVGVLHGYGTPAELADADVRVRGLSPLPDLARQLLGF